MTQNNEIIKWMCQNCGQVHIQEQNVNEDSSQIVETFYEYSGGDIGNQVKEYLVANSNYEIQQVVMIDSVTRNGKVALVIFKVRVKTAELNRKMEEVRKDIEQVRATILAYPKSSNAVEARYYKWMNKLEDDLKSLLNDNKENK